MQETLDQKPQIPVKFEPGAPEFSGPPGSKNVTPEKDPASSDSSQNGWTGECNPKWLIKQQKITN